MKGKVCPECSFISEPSAVCCSSCSEDILSVTIIAIDKSQIERREINTEEGNDPLKSLFSFQGRVKRSTFWIIFIITLMISADLLIQGGTSTDRGGSSVLVMLMTIFFIPTIWVAFSTYVKRWHDLNKSGWMVLTLFIPFVNLLIFLYLGLASGSAGPNKYGEKPQ